jgi:glucan phosphoethanolaminetransferase (alkaline phosphatase superfamily)
MNTTMVLIVYFIILIFCSLGEVFRRIKRIRLMKIIAIVAIIIVMIRVI